MKKLFKNIKKKVSGQGMVEYGLILALVSIVTLGTLGGIGDSVKGTFEKVVDGSGFVEVVKKHIVTFIDFEGEVIDSVEVVDGGSALAPEAPVIEGHTFIGWEGEFTDVSEDVTISSKYVENYTITFRDVNGRLIGVDSVSPGGDAKVPNKLKLNTTEDIWDKPLDNIQSDGVIALSSYAIIETADDLNNVRKGLSGKYIQVNNIDLSKFTNFIPIGTFGGIYDGGGYKINNLTINRGSNGYNGLFGQAIGATFLNVGLEDVDVTGGNYTGGLVGRQQDSSITNSYATGSVKGGGDCTGGLVGLQNNSSTTNSYATGSVTGANSNTGGLIGHQQYLSIVTNSYATGSVTSTGAGGLVGGQYNSFVTNSYATGSVTGGTSNSGGLVGHQQSHSHTNPPVSDSYYDTETTRRTTSAGGTGKTTAEMKKQTTYSGWNFTTIWEITDGQYPTLR